MWSTSNVVLSLFLAVQRVLTAQIPLSLDYHGQWDLDEPPAVNATGNLVFETGNSLLQHWENTRYRIGRLQQLGCHLTFMHLYIVQVTQSSQGLSR